MSVIPAPAAPAAPTVLPAPRDRSVALLLSVAVPIVAGAVGAWALPRGPVTVPDALPWMTGVALVGLAAGFLAGSRWSLLLAPVAFWLAFEFGRAGTSGPPWTPSMSARCTGSSRSWWAAA